MPIQSSNPLTPQDPSVPNVIIETGTITPDDYLAKYNIQSPGTVITDYQVKNRYFKDKNKFMAGVTSSNGFNGKTVSVFQLSTPTMIWVAEWTGCREGEPPVVPNPAVDPDWELLDEYFETYRIGICPDGVTPIWRISGTYIYGKFSPAENTINDVVYPAPPWLNDSGIERTLTAQNLQGGIIDIQRVLRTVPGLPGLPRP